MRGDFKDEARRFEDIDKAATEKAKADPIVPFDGPDNSKHFKPPWKIDLDPDGDGLSAGKAQIFHPVGGRDDRRCVIADMTYENTGNDDDDLMLDPEAPSSYNLCLVLHAPDMLDVIVKSQKRLEELCTKIDQESRGTADLRLFLEIARDLESAAYKATDIYGV